MHAAVAIAGAMAIYVLYGILAYHPDLKTRPWFVWAGLLCALGTNLIWIHLAKATHSGARLLFYNLVWDGGLVAITILVPLMVFGVRPTMISMLGMALTVVGIILMKLGT